MPVTSSPTSRGVPIVVMGVSGAGKTTVGETLAQRLNVPFADADDYHPSGNIAKMAGGEPLDDADRYPWLERVGRWLAQHSDGGVMSCSALKRDYRDRLRAQCPDIAFLHLTGSAQLIAGRQAARTAHFMPSSLMKSQFEALEPLGPDENGVTADISADADSIVDTYLASAGRPR